jgi:hypothetical protein
MKKLLTLILVLLLASSFVMASEASKVDAGLRLGIMNTFGGVSARMALSETSKVEAIISTNAFSGSILTGMYQLHNQVGDVQDLTWYVGGGLHMGYWKSAPMRWSTALSQWISQDFSLGLDAVAGIQYDMRSLIDFPLLISLDYKPSFDLLGKWSDNLADFSLSIRYAF